MNEFEGFRDFAFSEQESYFIESKVVSLTFTQFVFDRIEDLIKGLIIVILLFAIDLL